MPLHTTTEQETSASYGGAPAGFDREWSTDVRPQGNETSKTAAARTGGRPASRRSALRIAGACYRLGGKWEGFRPPLRPCTVAGQRNPLHLLRHPRRSGTPGWPRGAELQRRGRLLCAADATEEAPHCASIARLGPRLSQRAQTTDMASKTSFDVEAGALVVGAVCGGGQQMS